MQIRNPWIVTAIAATSGALHWALCSMVVGGEAWDGAIYFLSLPLLALACTAIGALHAEQAWRWGAIAAMAQAAGLFLISGEIGSLFPITLALFAVLGGSLSLCSALGAYLVKTLCSPGT